MAEHVSGRWAAVVLSGGALLAATACGGSGADADGAESQITLTIHTFGTFGYEALYEEFEAEHPKVTVEPRNTKFEDYTAQLEKSLDEGSADDVVAIEEGFMGAMRGRSDDFVDLRDYGAGSMAVNFLDWKWEGGMTADGKLIGLGTDMGSLAMCYRRDLFEQAGLPTDREEVGALWETWDDFLATGETFMNSSVNAKFIDTVTQVYNTRVMQGADHTYFDRQGNLVIESNPAIEEGWQFAVEMVEADLTADVQVFTEAWTAGLQEGSFAVTTCPAWMLGQIKEAAGPELYGAWDVASVPGGGGNWGGSWLAVPTQSEHPQMAAELAKYLTRPEGQMAAFHAANNLPTSPQALEDAQVRAFTNPYFNNAPVGEIYASNAAELQPVYLGVDHQPVRLMIEETLRAMDTGEMTPQEAWDHVVTQAEQEAN
ncbi:ABC transporter substrate-binding protein [Salinactinospora qingdaonensis]|uniref:ABC transporter substrate-binding protein n=1 Tax=Salinactinospora qingdaonensis TaxID=702744 RepID=A0ABP7FGS6_9ACTN